MNEQRRMVRPRQPKIPDTPRGEQVMGSGSKSDQFSGCVGNGMKSDNCDGAQGQHGSSSRGQKSSY